MSLFSRRDFLKSAVIMLSAYPLLQPLAEAAEVKRRSLTKEPMPGKPEPLADPAGEKNALRFFVVGDWGWYGQPVSSKASEQDKAGVKENADGEITVSKGMGNFAVKRKPDAVISVGDNFYSYGVKSVDDPRFATTFEKAHDAPSLQQVPWYVALGNHDYRGSVQAQIDYSKKSPRWNMPARYFTFSKKAPDGTVAQFFILDTCPFHTNLAKGGHSDVGKQDKAAQLAWLEKELSESKATWKILAGHHPIWTGGVRRDIKEQDLDKILPPIMKKHGAQVYLCGHEHDSQHIEVDGIHNFLMGNGGDMRPTGTTTGSRYAESRLGFGHLTITAKTLRADFIDASGAVRHTAILDAVKASASPATAPAATEKAAVAAV